MTDKDFEAFVSAYLVAALWSSTDDGDTALDYNHDMGDFTETALHTMRQHCSYFLTAQQAGGIIEKAIETGNVYLSGDGSDEWSHAGHDFWLTRNGHGAGFWDGDWPEPYATQLTEICQSLPEIDLYITDDDQIAIA